MDHKDFSLFKIPVQGQVYGGLFERVPDLCLFPSDICKYLPNAFAQPRHCLDSQANTFEAEVKADPCFLKRDFNSI